MSQATLDDLFGQPEELPADTEKSLHTLAKNILTLRAEQADAETVLKEIRERLTTAEGILMLALDQAHMASMKLRTGETLTAILKSQFSLPNKDQKDDRAEVLAWLRRVGAKDMVEEQIHPATLTAFLREREEKKLPIHPKVKKFVQRSLRVAKS